MCLKIPTVHTTYFLQKAKHFLCSNICFSESKDNALLETVSNVQLDITGKGGGSSPILTTGVGFTVAQSEPAISHHFVRSVNYVPFPPSLNGDIC